MSAAPAPLGRRPPSRPAAGVVLLEVLLSVGLFAVGAGMMLMALRHAYRSAAAVTSRTQALHLAQSVLAELECGKLPLVETPLTEFDPQERFGTGWSYRIDVVTAAESPSLKQVTVTVRQSDVAEPAEHALSQWLYDASASSGLEGAVTP